MRCLVTGASGHLGSHLVRTLLRDGQQVAVLLRPQSDPARIARLPKELELIYADLRITDQGLAGLKRFEPDTVFHLAWSGSESAEQDLPTQQENVTTSMELFRLCQAAGAVTWVGIGSQAEYGLQDRPLSENMPKNPITAYGAAKLAVEEKTRELCKASGQRYVWFRLLATYGPNDRSGHLIPMTIRQLLAGQCPDLTAGEQRWDYLYVDDAAKAIAEAGTNTRLRGAYNLGSGIATRVRDIVEMIRDIIDPNLPLTFGKIPYSKHPIMLLQADISRLTSAAAWKPKTSLEAGLRRTIDWYRCQTD